jgi:hypothetical protein
MGAGTVTLAAQRTSASFDARGYSALTLEINLSARTAATTIDVLLETSNDEGTTWHRVQSVSVSGGTATLSDLLYQKTVSAADTICINIPINYSFMRIKVDGTSGAAGDVIAISARLGT